MVYIISMNPNFDTHKAVKNLIAHGISERHAEAIVETFNNHNDEVATKNDLIVTKQELKLEISELRADMQKMKNEMLIKLPAIIGAIFGLFRLSEQFIHFN